MAVLTGNGDLRRNDAVVAMGGGERRGTFPRKDGPLSEKKKKTAEKKGGF